MGGRCYFSGPNTITLHQMLTVASYLDSLTSTHALLQCVARVVFVNVAQFISLLFRSF